MTNYTNNVVLGGNALFSSIGALTEISPTTTTDAGIRPARKSNSRISYRALPDLATNIPISGGRLIISPIQPPAFPHWRRVRLQPTNNYNNIAPEGALVFHPNSEWLVKARIATGYGTPQASNLFVTSSGLAGDNSQLKSQTNLGYDLSTTWTPLSTVLLTVDGFYEFFHNELISNSPGPAPIFTYTFNAPRSEHRGVEVFGEWSFYLGWKARVSYPYNNQIYTQYDEQLSAGSFTQTFDRAGHWIPGVAPNTLYARVGYDFPDGQRRASEPGQNII